MLMSTDLSVEGLAGIVRAETRCFTADFLTDASLGTVAVAFQSSRFCDVHGPPLLWMNGWLSGWVVEWMGG